MSSYICNTKNPATGEFEAAQWLDNYFGPRHYGVKFLDGSMVDPEEVELETNHDELIDLKPSDPEATLRPSKSPNHIEPNIVPNDNTDGPMTSAKSSKLGEDTINLCQSCHCMTHTIHGYCGKCKALKPSEDTKLPNMICGADRFECATIEEMEAHMYKEHYMDDPQPGEDTEK